MNRNYKSTNIFWVFIFFWVLSSNVFASDCGKLNGVSLPCYRNLLSRNEGEESLPFYPYAKRENGCSIPPAKPGANDTIRMASININFTDICNKHDRCYYTVGTRALQDCNIPFYNKMRARCEREISNHAFTLADLLTFGGTRAGVLTACYTKSEAMGKITAGTGHKYHTEAQKNQKKYLKKIKDHIYILGQKVENAFMDILRHKSGNTMHWIKHMKNVGYAQMRQDIAHSSEGQESVEVAFRQILNHTSGNTSHWTTHLGNVGYTKMCRDIRCSSEGISRHGPC